MQKISLRDCTFDKQRKHILVSSEVFAGGFPKEFVVVSHHTNNEVVFRPVQPGHRLFDEDCWDGEMCIYLPTVSVPNVDHLTIIHEY